MSVRLRVAIAAALAAIAAATLGVQAPAAPTAHGHLVAFRSCGDLLGYAKAHATRFVTAYGIGQTVGAKTPLPLGAAAPGASRSSGGEGVDYSGTNVQEEGVDEPDVVKTNGSTLFAVENGRLEAVDVGTGKPKLRDTLELTTGWSQQLLLYGTHLLVLSRSGYWLEPLPGGARAMLAPVPSNTTLTEVDVSNPSALKVVQTLSIDGAYLDARMVGSSVRLVSSTAIPSVLPFVTPSDPGVTPKDAEAKNRAVVASSRLTSWVPTYRLGKGRTRPLVNCRSVRHPTSFSGLGMLTVTTIDLAKGLAPVDSTAVMSDGRIVYASPTGLYVATERWSVRPLPAKPNTAVEGATTQIHAFDISNPERTRYLGSGTVRGYLLNQWSLSEYKGALRVVSTESPAWWGATPDSESFLTTLQLHAGALTQTGQLDGLGKGDRVYGVRMIGDTAYVVTFRQIDPLYTVDLGDPAHPRLLGKLELPGYSSYLHPISDNLLLGIGQAVDEGANEPSGTQVSLFDVSDPAHVKRVAHATLGQGWSAAESDHHAFLYWPATGLVVVPFGQQAVAMHVSRAAGIDELGRIAHTEARQSQLPQIDRSVVVGKALLTLSSAGVASNGLTSLDPLGWQAFPAPPTPKPVPGGSGGSPPAPAP
jgi:uncharacterized secreted protein with C-terminal beta-propeller domain